MSAAADAKAAPDIGEFDAVDSEDVVSGRFAEFFAPRPLVGEHARVDEEAFPECGGFEAEQVAVGVGGEVVRADVARIEQEEAVVTAMEEVVAVEGRDEG